MIKVLVLVDHAKGISGPHRNVISTLNALSERSDIDLRLLTGEIDNDQPYATQCDIQLGFEPHNIRKVLNNLHLLKQAIRDRDLIYVSSGLKAFLYAYLMKRKRKLVAGPNITGIPFLMDMSNPSPLMTMRMSDAWIENSELRVQDCILAGTPREYIHLVSHAKDANYFNPQYCDESIWEDYGINQNSIKIIYVGRMDEERKGIHQLIQAFNILQNKFTEKDIQLILVGKEGKMLREEHKKNTNVNYFGFFYGKRLVKLLASADIFMAASSWETFWHTPLEAMSCGLPIVVSTAGSVPLMIPENGVQGYAVNIVDSKGRFLPDAAERLAKAASPLIMDKDLRLEIGKRARDHVVENFSEKRRGDLIMEIFTKTMEGNGKRDSDS